MYTIYNNKKIIIKEYKSFFKKLGGFMFKKKADYGIYFKNCNSIHTFFCYFPSDIYFLYTYKNVRKNKIILPKKDVKNTIEIPTGLCDKLNLKDGN